MSLFCCSGSVWETDMKFYVSLTAWPLKTGLTSCPETSVINNHSMLRKIPPPPKKKRRSQNDSTQICQSIRSITAGRQGNDTDNWPWSDRDWSRRGPKCVLDWWSGRMVGHLTSRLQLPKQDNVGWNVIITRQRGLFERNAIKFA
jgi:hypothetical protein